MVPVQLIEDLSEELKTVLSHMRLPSPKGEETEINIFQYGLPIEKTKEDAKKKVPYVLIIPTEGELTGGNEPQTVKVECLIGLYDDNKDNQGKKAVMNVINDICSRFAVNPVLKDSYYAEEKMEWVVDREEEYPYHYGAVWLDFNVPAVRRENEYA